MEKKLDWRFKFLIGSVLLLVLGYVAFWFAAAHIARKTLDEMIAAQRAAGFEITYADLSTGGFPFQIELEFKTASFGRPAAFEPFSVTSPRVQIIAMPWNPDHIIVFADTPRLEKSLGKKHLPDGREQPVAFVAQAKSLQASRITLEGAWQATDIVLDQVLLGGLNRPDWVRIGNLELHGHPVPRIIDKLTAAPLAELSLLIEHMKPNAALGPVIGQPVQRLTATARYRGDDFPAGFDKETVLAWRDTGGQIDIDQLHLDLGQVSIDVKGALTLDSKSRPLAVLRTEIGNYGLLVQGLEQTHTLTPDTAKQLLSVLDQIVSINGGVNRRLRTDLAVTNGQMFVGPMLVMDFVPPMFNDETQIVAQHQP